MRGDLHPCMRDPADSKSVYPTEGRVEIQGPAMPDRRYAHHHRARPSGAGHPARVVPAVQVAGYDPNRHLGGATAQEPASERGFLVAEVALDQEAKDVLGRLGLHAGETTAADPAIGGTIRCDLESAAGICSQSGGDQLLSPASSSRSGRLGGGTRARRPAASQSGPRSSSGSGSPSRRGRRSPAPVTRARNSESPRKGRATRADLGFGQRTFVLTCDSEDSWILTRQERLSVESSGSVPVSYSKLPAVACSVPGEVEDVVPWRGNGLLTPEEVLSQGVPHSATARQPPEPLPNDFPPSRLYGSSDRRAS